MKKSRKPAQARGRFTEALRGLLRNESLKGRCSAVQIARHFSMDRRTLNRRLEAEGTSFKVVANAVRFEIAQDLLADTDLTLEQVSAALDFSEPAAFTRAFARWSGYTPSAWRAVFRSEVSRPRPSRNG